MRILLALLLATPAVADNHVTAASADLLVAPKLKEMIAVVGRYALPHAEIETVRGDFVELYDNSQQDVRLSFLAGAFRLDRPTWGFTVGAHLGAVWTGSVRYLIPYGSLRIGAGDGVHVTFDARSQGLYVAAVEDAPERAVMRDFDLEARLVTPGRSRRWEVRTRYRDIDAGVTHVRDAIVCTGLRFGIAHSNTTWLPVFVGLGIRQERWRDAEQMPIDGPVETAPHPTWETLFWFAIDFGADGQIWPK